MDNRSKKVLAGVAAGAVTGGVVTKVIATSVYNSTRDMICAHIPEMINSTMECAKFQFTQHVSESGGYAGFTSDAGSTTWNLGSWGMNVTNQSLPVFMSMLNSSFHAANSLVGSYIVNACVATLDAYSFVPKACAFGTLVGALAGSTFGYFSEVNEEALAVTSTPPAAESENNNASNEESDNESDTPTVCDDKEFKPGPLLQSQSFFRPKPEATNDGKSPEKTVTETPANEGADTKTAALESSEEEHSPPPIQKESSWACVRKRK